MTPPQPPTPANRNSGVTRERIVFDYVNYFNIKHFSHPGADIGRLHTTSYIFSGSNIKSSNCLGQISRFGGQYQISKFQKCQYRVSKFTPLGALYIYVCGH